jgi:CheY-like chemotaxis protein
VPRLLVAEDDLIVRRLIRCVAERAGFEAVDARNGAEALARLRCERFDVMITDLFMPDTDGIELIRRVRPLAATLPIVAISGGGEVGINLLGVARFLGAQYSLSKPFDVPELARVLDAAVSSARNNFLNSPCDWPITDGKGPQVACG